MPRAVRILLLAAGLGVIGLLIRHAGPQLIWDMLVRVGWRVPIACGIFTFYLFVRAVALWRSAPPGSVRLSEALRVRISGDVIEVLTFTGPLFAEPAKGWLLAQRGLPASTAFTAVAIEWVVYDIATSVLEAGAVMMLLARDAIPPLLRPGAIAVLIVPFGFLAACAWASVTGAGVVVPIIRWARVFIGRRTSVRAMRAAAPVERALVHFLHAERRRFAEVLAIEAASQLLLILEVWVVLTALGSPGLMPAVIVEGGAKLIGLVFSFVPGQVGAAEGVYALLIQAIGGATATGVTLALVRRVRNLIVATAGLAALTLSGSNRS